MKISLINPPNPDPPPSYFGPHYGLSLLGGILERAGYAVKGHDFDLWERGEMMKEIPRVMRRDAPDLVGISCVSSSRLSSFALADEIKRLYPAATVIVGGPFASLEPDLILKRSRADFVGIGDGEETLLELAEALASGRSPKTVRGLAFRSRGAVRRSPPRDSFHAVDSLPYPAFHLFDAARELKRHRRPEVEALAGPVSTAGRRCLAMHSALMALGSRGCVYRCVFCPMSRFRGPVRRHSPEYFVGMVEHLAKTYGQRNMVFGDNFFTLNREWVREVCDGIVARKLKIDWICMTRPDSVDRELLRRMARAGCREISYGLESGSPKIQKRAGKRMKLENVAPAFKATKEAGISSTLMLMVGNPGESRATIRETAAFSWRLEPDRILALTTKVYPGTALHDRARKEGVIPKGFYEQDHLHAPPYTGELDRRGLKDLHEMLRPRTAYIAVGAGCVNGCCALRKPRGKNGAASMEQLLALSSLRAERIVLGGGEPFLRKDLRTLLRLIKTLKFREVELYTTARPLAKARVCELLLGGGLLKGIVVPLFSPDPKRHDKRARVPGALLRTRLGLLRWSKAGGSIKAWAFLDRENVGRLPEWVLWLAEHGVAKAVFLYGRSPPGWGAVPGARLPRMLEAARAIRDVLPRARRAGVVVSVFGIPECLVQDKRIPHEELRRPFDERLSAAGEPVALSSRRRGGLKTKPRSCRKCRVVELCEGIWKDYLERYGGEEFRAL